MRVNGRNSGLFSGFCQDTKRIPKFKTRRRWSKIALLPVGPFRPSTFVPNSPRTGHPTCPSFTSPEDRRRGSSHYHYKVVRVGGSKGSSSLSSVICILLNDSFFLASLAYHLKPRFEACPDTDVLILPHTFPRTPLKEVLSVRPHKEICPLTLPRDFLRPLLQVLGTFRRL